MKRLFVLALVLAATLLFAQSAQDLYDQVLVSRIVGKWKMHTHFEKMPDDFPHDYYGTVEAKWTFGMHVLADVKVDAPAGGQTAYAAGVLGSEDGLEVDGTPTHALNCFFYDSNDSGYLPMSGPLKGDRVILEGDRVPKDPNGGKWKASVEFKSRDEIDIWLLEEHSDPKGPTPNYIKLTRDK